jgi:hypothetical protein
MLRLLSFPEKDPPQIEELRRKVKAAPSNTDLQIELAIALAQGGCTYEAAALLRSLRSHWKSTANAQSANAALDAQAWWNKNWRDFARLNSSGNKAGALALLGDRAVHYWDLPPLLMHLGGIAVVDGHLELASHVFHRVFYLSQRGLPKMNMEAFTYVSQAALVDILCSQGHAVAALDRHLAINSNSGNAMGHEMQHAKLLVAAGHFDQAMCKVASMLVTANKHRNGYSKDMRNEFVQASDDLRPLRGRSDWKDLLQDPDGYLRDSRKMQRTTGM